MRWKRALYLTHRWSGIALCLLFAMWFFSGVVMIYLPFPNLGPNERFAGLDPVEATRIKVDVVSALAAAGSSTVPERIRMTTVAGRPAYHFLPRDEGWITVFADNGTRLESVTNTQAVATAAAFRRGSKPIYVERSEMDQWTVSGNLRPYRPLHRVALQDSAGTQLYVSDRTGEVVRDTERSERVGNWLGANLHWIYPLGLVRNRALWHEIVVWLSLAGTLVAATGCAAGVLRWRFRGRYRNGRCSPYQGWMRWHHVIGLGASVFVLTSIFSGLLSMNPWKVFPPKAPSADEVARFGLGALEPADYRYSPADLLPGRSMPVKEIEWVRFAGRPYYVFHIAPKDSRLYPADRVTPGFQRFAESELARQAKSLKPDARMIRTEWLTKYDNYWYERQNLGRLRPLPVLRVGFDDEDATWYHINPYTGQLVDRLTCANRLQRWLYNGLHSLDFVFLLRNRPLWDVLVITLSAAGFALSVTGLVIGWQRLTRRATRSGPRAQSLAANPTPMTRPRP